MGIEIHNCAQGELEWVRLRLGRPTASEFHRFMTTKFELRDKGPVDTYLNEKLAETMLGHALPAHGSFATEQGEMMENEARRWFAMEHDCEPVQVGFVANGRCGCSPDGLIEEDAGLEIKCPYAQTHVGYLRGGKVPADYVQQVHGSLYVTERAKWHFVSYRRGLPKLVVTVERDSETMEKIGACLDEIYKRFDTALAQLRSL